MRSTTAWYQMNPMVVLPILIEFSNCTCSEAIVPSKVWLLGIVSEEPASGSERNCDFMCRSQMWQGPSGNFVSSN